MDEGTPTEVEFDAMLRQRTTEPDVRAMMSALREQFDYGEDPESFRWLVIDATRIVDRVRCGRECHPDWVPDDRAYILDAMVDSARWDPDEPEPVAILDALEAVLADG